MNWLGNDCCEHTGVHRYLQVEWAGVVRPSPSFVIKFDTVSFIKASSCPQPVIKLLTNFFKNNPLYLECYVMNITVCHKVWWNWNLIYLSRVDHCYINQNFFLGKGKETLKETHSPPSKIGDLSVNYIIIINFINHPVQVESTGKTHQSMMYKEFLRSEEWQIAAERNFVFCFLSINTKKVLQSFNK